MRPELELLLCCARARMDTATLARASRLISKGVNWDDLIRHAHHHGVVPLLYAGLCTLGPPRVPELVLNRLRVGFHANTVRCHVLSRRLLDLLALFEANGIPAIPLKGPTLAARAYGDLILRPSGDLDVLVRPGDYAQARALLLARRFRPDTYQEPGAREYLKTQVAEHFSSADERVHVDLHWAFLNTVHALRLTPERVWQRLEAVQLGDATVHTLSREDLLLYLCAHGSKHFWARLKWVCDVAELIRAQPLNWEVAMAQAHRLRMTRMLSLGLYLAEELLQAPLPEGISAHVRRTPAVAELARHACVQLQEGAAGSHSLRGFLFHLRMRDHLLDRLPYCGYLARLIMIPSARDRASLPLPDSLSFLHYLLRPLHLLARVGASVYRTA